MILKHGDQRRLADTAGVQPSMLSEILNGKKRCPSALAVKLELISQDVLGQKVMASEWILAGLGLRTEGGLHAEGVNEGTQQDRAGDCCTGDAAGKCQH